MAQISSGTVAVTNGSQNVVGTDTTWADDGVAVGDGFTIVDSGVTYDVASVTDNTHLTLSTNYAGTTDSGLSYTIYTDYTSPDNIPELNKGDIETATIFTRAMRVIQDKFVKVSQQKMSTTVATAGQYAKLETFSFPATNNVAAVQTLLLTPKSASGSYAPIMLTVTALQGTSGLSTSSKIEILHNDGTAAAYNDFFLVTAAATNGTDIELYMQSIIAAAYDVQVLSESLDTGISVAWNDGATWSATNPTSGAAASVTSAWESTGPFTPVAEGTTTAGAGTYTLQVGYYTIIKDRCFYDIRIGWSAHTGTGGLRITGLPVAANGSYYAAAVDSDELTIGSGKQLSALVITGTTYLSIRAIDVAGGGSSNLTMDTAISALHLTGSY